MAKNKPPTMYEIALDIVRAPVRKLDETIQLWDSMATQPGLAKFNQGTRVASVIGSMKPEDARRIAQTVLDFYAPRFQQCVIYPITSAHTGRPLYVGFTFYEIAWREPRGVIVEL